MANDPRFEVYPRKHDEDDPNSLGGPRWYAGDRTGDFGWRFRAANGQITAIGGESFTRIEDAERAIVEFLDTLPNYDSFVYSGNDPVALRVDE